MFETPEISPLDTHNRALLARVHPQDWKNPEPASRYHLVVIGAGTAGLVTAAAAAGLGARVALVEHHLMGGDCLNFGCVPSKTLIRSSRAAAALREAAGLGVRIPEGTDVDFAAVMERVRKVRARIGEHDSVERFQRLGVDVFLGQARFSAPDRVEVDGTTLSFRKAVIATGARPVEPSIPGLKEAGYLTNLNVFNLTERPGRLVVVGGGPIGIELAQAFARLGSRVTVVEMMPQFLVREDPDAAEILARALERDGVRLLVNTRVSRVGRSGSEKRVHLEMRSGEEIIPADELLVGVGRRPNLEGLNLEAVGVRYTREGVVVSDRLQTTNRRIYAAGDICLSYKFTHAADASARVVVQNALFLGRKKFSGVTIPWCTYTDPEIAHVGLTEKEAREKGIPVRTFKVDMKEVDRAVADGDEEGFVKIHVKEGTDRIVGATMVSRHAGETIGEVSLAMTSGIGLGAISGVVHPYPTQAEAIRKAADAYNRTRLTPRVQKILGYWLRWTG